MERFRTVVSPVGSSYKMAISDRILTIGSCFSDVVGKRMLENKLQCLANPFGTLYNPASIHRAATYSLQADYPSPETYLKRGEIVLNYDFHSQLSALSQAEVESKIHKAIDGTTEFISKSKWLIITYGTAWAYVRKDNGDVVANCHKTAQSFFRKLLMTESAIVDSFSKFYEPLKTLNPEVNVVLTVSPVRHVKDTLELNSVSKGILRSACYQLTQQFPDVSYFPAFEIMIDDLRDYRFYKADMIHPNDVAEDYIWEKFMTCYGDQQLITFVSQWREIQNAMHHKPFHEGTLAHQTFLEETLRKLQAISNLVDVNTEMDALIKKTFKTSRQVDIP